MEVNQPSSLVYNRDMYAFYNRFWMEDEKNNNYRSCMCLVTVVIHVR